MFVDDKTRIAHMIDASEEAVAFSTGKSQDDVYSDRLLALCLVKCLEMMGEAASKVSHKLKEEHPEIDWKYLIEIRHHLVHEYHDINAERVWKTIKLDLPDIIKSLRLIKIDNEAI